MREARIILPINGNDGGGLSVQRATAEAAIFAAFGGYTASAGYGAWRDPETGDTYREPVGIYDIAAEGLPGDSEALAAIGELFARDAGQLAVYVRDFSGEVLFVKPAEAEASRNFGTAVADALTSPTHGERVEERARVNGQPNGYDGPVKLGANA